MTTHGANHRAALASLDVARPLVARLDVSRHPEDIAADMIEAWGATEASLRTLMGGSPLAGQALIRELRQRELLSLDTAHALLEFQAARDRVQRTEYRPTSADVAAAREGLRNYETSLVAASSGVPGTPGAAPAAVPGAGIADTYAPPPAPRGKRALLGVPVIAALVALLVVAGALGWWFLGRDSAEAGMERGIAAYTEKRVEAARGEFTKVARDNPELAAPHIYLGRIAREEQDFATASRELQTAVRLEPDNALAQRELAAVMLAMGNAELARRFYVRAIQLDPTDRNSVGFLGCALMRLGRFEEAQRFLTRAGPGPWMNCAPAAAPGAPQLQRPL